MLFWIFMWKVQESKLISKAVYGTSLVVQQLELPHPMQGVGVQSLVRDLKSHMPPAMRVLVLIAGPPGKFPSNSLSVSFPDHNYLEVFSNLSSEHGNMRWSLNRKTHYFLLSLVTY